MSKKTVEAITSNQHRGLPTGLLSDWEPLCYVDATPNDGYVLRILRAHRINCLAKWGGTPSEVLEKMNEWQDERRKLLDAAIKILERSHHD